jgi:transposase-like protein
MKPSAVQSVFAMIWRPEFDVYSMSAIARALGCSHETVQKARRLVRQGDQSLRLRMAIWDDLLAALETLEVLRAKFPETALLCNRVQHAVLQMEREGAAGLATSPARP